MKRPTLTERATARAKLLHDAYCMHSGLTAEIAIQASWIDGYYAGRRAQRKIHAKTKKPHR